MIMSDTIDFSRSDISILNDDRCIRAIKQQLKSSLTHINLSNNNISDVVLEDLYDELFSDLSCLSKICSIDLSFNRITTSGLIFLYPCVISPTCTSINLKFNYIEDSALLPFYEAGKLVT